MSTHAHYRRVFWTFFRNSLVREMTFRGNFLITIVTRAFWFAAQLTLFELIFRSLGPTGTINDWSRYQYFAFMATGMLINSVVETFFMPNCANYSELIRTGNLDFALLKPIDTQFLVSFEKVNLAMLNQILLAGALLGYSLYQLKPPIGVTEVVFYLLYLFSGVIFFYSLMISLASTCIWFGRNQGLYDFWFYITVFARYPRSIYSTGHSTGSLTAGEAIQFSFTYVIPILLVVTVPARVLLSTVREPHFLAIALGASLGGLLISRLIFQFSLKSYRSASS